MKTLTAPDGKTWRVRRHWVRFRPRWRGADPWGLDFFPVVDDVPGIGGIIVALVLGLALLFFVLPLFILLVEILIIVIAVAGVVAANFILRRPWIVVAESPRPHDRHAWQVVGWRRANEAIELIASDLRASGRPPVEIPHGRAVTAPTR